MNIYYVSVYFIQIQIKELGNKEIEDVQNSQLPQTEQGITKREEIRYQTAEIYGKFLEHMKKIVEFEDNMNHNFITKTINIPKVNFSETGKKLDKKIKRNNNLNNRFNKDMKF